MRCIPTSYFQVTGFLWKNVGMHLICYYPYYSCLQCTFWPCHPYLLYQFILPVAAFYTCMFFFSSIVTESEGHGLLNSLWHEAMHRYGQVSLCVVYPNLDPSETAAPSCSTVFNILEYDLSTTKTALKYGEYVTCTSGLARARLSRG